MNADKEKEENMRKEQKRVKPIQGERGFTSLSVVLREKNHVCQPRLSIYYPSSNAWRMKALTCTHALQCIIRLITFQLMLCVHVETHAEIARLTRVQL